MTTVKVIRRKTKGGPGSGNWGHSGRPGQVGGSNPGGGASSARPTWQESRARRDASKDAIVGELEKSLPKDYSVKGSEDRVIGSGTVTIGISKDGKVVERSISGIRDMPGDISVYHRVPLMLGSGAPSTPRWNTNLVNGKASGFVTSTRAKTFWAMRDTINAKLSEYKPIGNAFRLNVVETPAGFTISDANYNEFKFDV